ncbi:MAG TPA: hypothetical protein VFC90_03870 [Planctomycetota bacterium]|nr:hypothetical protein [Planctomycetota bacterium]
MRRALLLLATGGALAASVAAATECFSCGGPPVLALAGVVAYAGLLIAALLREDHGAVRMAYVGVSGFHLGLICALASRGTACSLCLATAAFAFAATVFALARDRGSWPLVPVVMPWTAALGLLVAPPPPTADFPAHTRIVAYTREDCGYCDELRHRVLPEATRGLDVEIEYRDAAAAAFVRRAPTLLLSRGPRYRLMEGLPTVDRLREELVVIGGGRP